MIFDSDARDLILRFSKAGNWHPRYVPPSWLFIQDAFERVGQALYNDQWTGEELRAISVQERERVVEYFETGVPGITTVITRPKGRGVKVRFRPVPVTLASQVSMSLLEEWASVKGDQSDFNSFIPAADGEAANRRSSSWERLRDGLASDNVGSIAFKPLTATHRVLAWEVWAAMTADSLLDCGFTPNGAESVGADMSLRPDAEWVLVDEESLKAFLATAPAASEEHSSATDEKKRQLPDSMASTSEKRQPGRPSLDAEILGAYDDLVKSQKITHPTTKTATYPIVRKRVREMFPDKVQADDKKGLGDEAIRKAIRGRFDENKARAKPPKASP